jgi:hypothetical protein
MTTMHAAAIRAIKLRARKCEVHPDILAKFLALAKSATFPRAVNGNSLRWRKNGCIAHCSMPPVNGTFTSYEMTVVTVWEGYKYTLVSKLVKSVLSPNSGLAFEDVARAEEVHVTAPFPGVTQ